MKEDDSERSEDTLSEDTLKYGKALARGSVTSGMRAKAANFIAWLVV